MASSSKVLQLILYTALLLPFCLVLSSNASTLDTVHEKRPLRMRRFLLKAELADNDEEDKPSPPPKKTKPTTTTTTSHSKILTKSSTTSDQLPPPKPKLKKLNTTSSTSKLSSPTSSKNSTTLITTKLKKLTNNTTSKLTTDSTKKSPNLINTASPKSNTTKIGNKNLIPPNSTTTPKSKNITKTATTSTKSIPNPKISKPNPNPKPKPSLPSWIDQDEEDDDLVNGFRNLPSKFQQTLFPDLETISQTSKTYLTQANKEMTKNFKPIIGTKYASTTANIVSITFIIVPFLILSLLISRIKTSSSLQKLLIFINIYLAIYFSILSLSAIVTGLEPLRFLFATSQSTYVSIQIFQTLCYVIYLLLLIMYLVLVFSTRTGLGSKFLGLGQTFVGFAVGLHYYVSVFHRVVLHQPPKTNWKVHAVYATCFLLICLFASAERRKKEYMEEGGEEGKKS